MKITVLLINKHTFEVKKIVNVTQISISTRRWAIRASSTTYYATDDYICHILGVTE